MESVQIGIESICIICGEVFSSPYNYHKHNISQHSPEQLSRAILKLQHIQLPLSDPPFAYEDLDDDEEERRKLELDMADVLDLPLRYDLMGEEVIELGPTENADNLQVKSRLVKNPNDAKQQSRQIIEVLENQPPPCYLDPAVEDPNANIVKFNRDLVMALDSSQPLSCSKQNKKHLNRALRASFKTSIEIPDPKTLPTEHRLKKCTSNYDKYVMQNVMFMQSTLRKPRGRPKKVSKMVSIEVPAISPPFCSDNEEEKAATVLNVTRSRSGRIIKQKKGDNSFEYYDTLSQGSSEIERRDEETAWNEDKAGEKLKGRYKRKRPISSPLSYNNKAFPNTSAENEAKSDNKSEDFLVEVSEVEEGMSMPLITHHIEDDTCISVEPSRTVEPVNSAYACLTCFKSFSTESEYEMHTKEHREKETNESLPYADINDRLLVKDSLEKEMIQESENSGNKEHDTFSQNANSENSGSSPENKDMYSCSDCDLTFKSRSDFTKHLHGPSRQCTYCGKKYSSHINLQSHIKKYHKETDWMKFKCAVCDKNFGFLKALERHMKEHTPNQKFCCEQCGKVFKNLTNLKNHISLHTRELVFECSYCSKQYYNKYSYEKHLKTHNSTPQYFCSHCESAFVDRRQWEKHKERHEISGNHGRSKNYKCNNCGDVKTSSDLNIVGITDTGHHKTCIVCGKGLYKKYRFIVAGASLKAVQDKVDRQREQCKLCGKYVLNLTRHIKSTHLVVEYVSCDLCGLVVTKASLASHKNRKHGISSPVPCDHCKQSFRNVMCLREHITKVRKKEDPSKNVCKYCKEVVSSDIWKEHMRKHKRKCSDCGSAHFSSHEEFLAHLDSCRRCSNCNLSTFESREDFLNHIEICSSGIDVITSSLDSTSEHEVVTSIFAIVDNNACEVCGMLCSDPELLAQHITESHPESLDGDPLTSDTSMIPEAMCFS
ncbi:hypothetical protein SK128_006430 [Halocaridina rubra]|uniref:C2H2-type domain-containing protein n=1 Tax=Halocaridina rubra TaxID=373956 RepID=A0AAN8WAU0_HALRR